MAKKADNNVVPIKKVGRPPFHWTPEMEEFIWFHMAGGSSIRRIVEVAKATDFKDSSFPSYDVIMDRIKEDAEFGNKYHVQKNIQQDLLAEEIIDIVDRRHPDYANSDLEERKFAVSERRWLMGRLRRKKWGDIKMTEITGADGTPLIQPQVIDTRSMTPEAQMALYEALQLVAAQSEAEDAEYTEEEPE
jgi:hypothetical protein